MGNKKDRFNRPAVSLCLILGSACLSFFIIRFSADLPRAGADLSYAITIRHYGVDLREMERTVAIPLEDALFSIPGVKNVLTSSEYSRVRAFVRFEGRGAGRYEAIREAAQGVYESLPRSAQRPEIVSSNDSRLPVWTAAVFSSSPGEDQAAGGLNLAGLLERVVKPALEGIDGAGELEISGAGLPEIILDLDPEAAVSRSLSPGRLAKFLGMDDLVLPGGIIREGDRDTIITVDGRYGDTASLAGALIPLDGGRVIRLGDIARIYERDREPDTLSRLDGKRAALIAVMGSSGADLGKLSRRLGEELKKFAGLPLEFRVLSDRGAAEAAAFRSVFMAAFQGALGVALICALLGTGRASAGVLICPLMVPFICLVSAAILSLSGISLDRSLLAGLSLGVGAAVDAVILCSEWLGKAGSAAEGRAALKRLGPPLISGSATTIAALLPLGIMGLSSPGIRAIAWAVGTVTLVSLIVTLGLLPPFFFTRIGFGFPGFFRRMAARAFPAERRRIMKTALDRAACFLRRRGSRLLGRAVRLSSGHPRLVLLGALILSIAGIAALALAELDIGAEAAEDSVYAQIEFTGGFRAAEADRLLEAWALAVKAEGAVTSVQTSARTSSASALVSFDPRRASLEKIRGLIRSLPVPGAFVYIPETSGGERIWEISVTGDESEKCRELAEEMARICAGLPLVRETALNFKDSGGRIRLLPRREKFLEAGLGFSTAAETVRRAVHGPVAYKRLGKAGETDVRVRFSPSANPEAGDLRNLLIPGAGRALRLDTLMAEEREGEPSSVRREDRRRIASISVRTKAMDPRRAREAIMPLLGKVELPPGYAVEFDRGAIRAAGELRGGLGWFLLALLFCYIVIAATHESFGIALAILPVIPPSLAVPALVLAPAGHPLNAALACAFVAVSGMAVNGAVLIAGGFHRPPGEKVRPGVPAFYRVLRARLPALLATSGTTIAGSLPFLFLREGSNQVLRTLALVTGLGVAASCVCSLLMIPAAAKISPPIFERFEKNFEKV